MQITNTCLLTWIAYAVNSPYLDAKEAYREGLHSSLPLRSPLTSYLRLLIDRLPLRANLL